MTRACLNDARRPRGKRTTVIKTAGSHGACFRSGVLLFRFIVSMPARHPQREIDFDKGIRHFYGVGPRTDGVVAQLVEHHNGIVGVRGSNPLGSTIPQVSLSEIPLRSEFVTLSIPLRRPGCCHKKLRFADLTGSPQTLGIEKTHNDSLTVKTAVASLHCCP